MIGLKRLPQPRRWKKPKMLKWLQEYPITDRFGGPSLCPKRLASFGYGTLASEEKASEK